MSLVDGCSMSHPSSHPSFATCTPTHTPPLTPTHTGKEETDQHHSLYNMTEAHACFNLVQQLAMAYPTLPLSGRIGIITFYKQQAKKIKSLFLRHYGPSILDSIDINSVDGFQGQEKDIILLSCVRGHRKWASSMMRAGSTLP